MAKHRLENGNTGRRAAALAGLLAACLAGAWFFFVHGGNEEPAPPAAPAVKAEEPESEEEEEEVQGRRGRIETFEVFASRDPFLPVVEPPPGDGGGTTTPEDIAGGESQAHGGHRVRLVGVAEGTRGAQIDVNGTLHGVSEGENFAASFRLLSISGGCATMLFGDDQFTLCEGEEILK